MIRYGLLNDSVVRHVSSEELISLLSEVTRDIRKVIVENLPIITYKSHLKPYWTQELTRFSKEDNRLMNEWKAVGSP